MKKVKNLTENKALINTFKKLQIRTYLNKKFWKKKSFYLLKYKFLNQKFLKPDLNQKFLKPDLNQKFLKITTMFINYIFIQKCKAITNTQRFKKSLFKFKFQKISKIFKYFFKNNAGRNNQGKLTLFSKGTKLKKNSILLHNINLWDQNTTIVKSIFRNKKKLYSLNKHLTGSFSIKPYICGVKLGQKLFFSNLPKKFWLNNMPGNFILLKFLTKYSIFSNLCLNSVRKYALSNGTFCQIFEYFSDFNLTKIVLPSKQTKIISSLSFVFLGKNAQEDYKYTRIGKAGYLSISGKKPKVRGVARNPVDHPHGGRTKTNQPEVSIWGWVAKRNK